MKEDALAVFRRRKIGFVFQAFNLVSSVNVWENIVLPLGLDGRKVDEAYVNDIIATLEYKSGTLDAKTFEKWLKYTSDEKIKSKLKTIDEFKD